jgi:hypothetical protein
MGNQMIFSQTTVAGTPPRTNARSVRIAVTVKKAAAADSHSGALQVPRLIGDACADCATIRLPADELESQPAVALGCRVAQQQRRVTDRDEHIDRAIVIEVGRWPALSRKNLWRRLVRSPRSYCATSCLAVKQQQEPAIGHVLLQGLDQIVRVAIGEEQIEIVIVVAIEKLQSQSAQQAGRGLEAAAVPGGSECPGSEGFR